MTDLKESGSKLVDYLKKPVNFMRTMLSAEDISRPLTFGTFAFGGFGTLYTLNELLGGLSSLNPYRIGGGIIAGVGTWLGSKHLYAELENYTSDYKMVEEILSENGNSYYKLFNELDGKVKASDDGYKKVFSSKVKSGDWVKWMLGLAEVHVGRHVGKDKKQTLRRKFERDRLKWLEETQPEELDKIAEARSQYSGALESFVE